MAEPSKQLSRALDKAEKLDAKRLLQQIAASAGQSAAAGDFTVKGAMDLAEMALHHHIAQNAARFDPTVGPHKAVKIIKDLLKLVDQFPTHNARDAESIALQQFSTPAHYAYLVAWVANLSDKDVVLEPSAGTGGLAVHAVNAGAKVFANEISERRRAMLSALPGIEVFNVNAEQLDNLLPPEIAPSVVLMNPPFSASVNQEGKKVAAAACQHIDQALMRLAEGGRLVAIVGCGSFPYWFEAIRQKYTLRAAVTIPGKEYRKHGVSIDTRLLIIDKCGATVEEPVSAEAESVADAVEILRTVRERRGEIPRAQVKARKVQSSQLGLFDFIGANDHAIAEVASNSRTGTSAIVSRKRQEPGSMAIGSMDLAGATAQSSRKDIPPLAIRSVACATVAPITDAIYEPYQCQRLVIDGAQEHPTPLVQSAAMASVLPPEPTYCPRIPRELVENGTLSLAQLEAIVYAGQAHQQYLPEQLVATAERAEVVGQGMLNDHLRRFRLSNGNFVDQEDVAALRHQGFKYTAWKPGAGPGGSAGFLGGSNRLDDALAAATAGPRKVRYRKGFFCGCSTGVGKGRICAGIILDATHNGQRRSLWISVNAKLSVDAKRDWTDLGGHASDIIELRKIKAGQEIPDRDGILFLTYGLLKSDRNGKPRMDQIIRWLGKDFAGVIAFDESHFMKSGFAKKGARGKARVSDVATAGIEIQSRLPDARVVYLSATGATEVANLAYCERLGLWGPSTSFPNKAEFINQVEGGGVAAMELVARDMKMMGTYISRSLSFGGINGGPPVEYDRLLHVLDPDQREIYDTVAGAWQVVLQNFDAALELTASYMKKDGDRAVDGKTKGRAYSKFWLAHQYFFNRVLTAMAMPSVLKDMEAELAAGNACVLQLVNTNEAAMERQLAKMEVDEDADLGDIDMTPREQLLQLIDHCFPTVQHEAVKIPGTDKVEMKPLVRDGQPVQNRHAVELKQKLMAEISTLRCPDGPLEMLLNHFGPNAVAEVTGRSRRVVRITKDGVDKTEVQARSPVKCLAEIDEFMGGERDILAFSDAGGTGKSYHSALTCRNQKRRIHYLIQAGWRADQALQGFGRTHRAGQRVPPKIKLVTTDLKGARRFTSTIARRLDQLGALTKGQRQAAGNGIFSSADNLESDYARAALHQLYKDIYAGKVPGLSLEDFEHQTGLKLADEDGGLRETLPPMSRWLNRLLSLKIAAQDALFDAFDQRLKVTIQKAVDEGRFDAGVETILADSIKKISERVIHTDQRTGAQTKHVELLLRYRRNPTPFEQVCGPSQATYGRPVLFYARNKTSGNVYAFTECNPKTESGGRVVARYNKIGPVSREPIDAADIIGRSQWSPIGGQVRVSNWEKIPIERAREGWERYIAALPEFVDESLHLCTGAVLPVWAKLKGSPKVKRLQTDDGERLLGRVIEADELQATLGRFNITVAAAQTTLQDLADKLMAGTHTFILSGGWKLKRSIVRGEKRIELLGPRYAHWTGELQGHGVMFEQIDGAGRFFVPVGPRAVDVLEKITTERQVASVHKVERAA